MKREYIKYNDGLLLELIKKGDRRAFEVIYKRHWEYLYTSAYCILRDRETSMDVVQEVFVWFWENRDRWNITTSRSYLNSAVKYKVANVIRRGRIRESVFSDVAERMQTIASVASAEEEVELMELKQIIREFTMHLPLRCREVFQLSRFEHLSNKEIAEKLGISEKTVENQITIALKKLKATLGHMAFWLVFFM